MTSPATAQQWRATLLKQARPFWLAMTALLAVSLLLLLVLPPPPEANPPLAPQRLVYLALALSCLCVGGIIGFLFGIPNTSQPKRDLTLKGLNTDSLATDQPSTNLEQVSDWLTKIIIGVGLVEANRLVRALGSVGKLVQDAAGGSVVVPQLVVVTFGTLGLACGYIWTRLYYGSLQITLDFDLRRYLAALGQAQQQQSTELVEQKTALTAVAAVITSKNASSPVPLPASPGLRAKSLVVPLADAPQAHTEWQAKLKAFLEAPVDENTDPTATIFGKLPAHLPDRKLSVTLLTPSPLGHSTYVIQAQVTGTAARPLLAKVVLLLHPTFSERAVEVLVDQRPAGGSATYSFAARGSFTLVAMADDGDTLLGYDLTDLPGVPPGW